MAEKKYIEIEAAIETIKSLYPSVPLVKLNIDKWHEKNKAYMECEIAIEALPAADVRPVVRCKVGHANRKPVSRNPKRYKQDTNFKAENDGEIPR